MVFPVVMYGCESWTIKKAENWRIDAFELWCWRRLLRVPWTCREIQPVRPKGNRSWIFIGRTDTEADVKSWLIGKDPDAGKDWMWEEKETTEDEMVGWHHRLSGHEFSKLRELVMDTKAWRVAVHGVPKSQTWLSDWTVWSCLYPLSLSASLPCHLPICLSISLSLSH